ncbi:MAG: PD-(D/E)XK nuclease family protein [Eubacteriales bacterium]|nr:PD-(D/E)XK nuclease family protein [Eubacteriales bacterium]
MTNYSSGQVKILHGADPRALLDRCLYELAEFTDTNPQRKAYLLVPESLKAESERRYLEKFARGGLLMADVLSFRRLAEYCLARTGAPAEPLSNFAELLILKSILEARESDFKKLCLASSKLENLSEIAKVLRDFSRHGLNGLEIQEASKHYPLVAGREKLQELGALYEAFGQASQARILKSSLSKLLTELLNSEDEFVKEALSWLEAAAIWIYGYGDLRRLSKEEIQLIAALYRKGADLHIALPLGEAKPTGQFGASKLSQLSLEDLLAEIPEAKPLYQEVEDGRAEESLAFATYIMGDNPEFRLKSAFTPQLVHAEDRYQAAEFLAGEIRRLLLSGVRRKEIAVAIFEQADEALIEEVFKEFELASELSRVPVIAESMLYRWLSFLGDLLGGESRVDKLLSGLENALRPEAVSLSALSILENLALAQGINYLSQFESKLDLPEGEARAAIVAIKKLQGELNSLRRVGSCQEIVADLEQYLDRCVLPSLETILAESEDEIFKQNNALCWRSVGQVLRDLKELFAERKSSLEEVFELLLTALAATMPPSIPLGVDRIAVGSMRQLLAKDVAYLFCFNTSLDNLPPPLPAEGLLLASERSFLKAVVGENFPNNREDYPETNAYLLSQIFSLPRRGLIFLHCQLAEPKSTPPYLTGETLSRFELRLASLGPEHILALESGQLPDQRALVPEARRRILARFGRQYLANYPGDLAEAIRTAWFGDFDESLSSFYEEPARLALAKQQWPGLAQDQLLGILKQLPACSASSLRNIANCPYQAFQTFLLGAKERAEAVVNPLSKGSFIHLMLELLLPQFAELAESLEEAGDEQLWLNYLRRDLLPKIYQRAANTQGLNYWLEPEIYGNEGQKLLNFLPAFIHALQREDRGFRPRYAEWQFPKHSAAVQLDFPLAAETASIALSGVIDRIDEKVVDGLNLLSISDYKTGSQDLDEAAIQAGLDFQLPLYIYVANQYFKEAKVAEASILRLDSSNPKTVSLGQGVADLNYLKESKFEGVENCQLVAAESLAKARATLSNFFSGDIAPRPRVIAGTKIELAKLPCHYCRFKSVCGFDRRRIFAQVEELAEAKEQPNEVD